VSICAVVMAGGSGTRLWPVSRAKRPKQFLTLHGEETMLQSTFSRLSKLDIQSSLTICNEDHRFFVAEQLQQIGQKNSIILEPNGRNTAPAIALAAFSVTDDPLLLVLSADHLIQDQASFTDAVSAAIPLAESGKLVTFGVMPTDANTGYGYIKRGKKQGSGFAVDRFEEKPSDETAGKYVESGIYFWNSGMFLFRASRYLEELKKFRPDIYKACKSAMDTTNFSPDFIRVDEEKFNSCPGESIDYAVMENTKDAIVVPMEAGWSDIGSWSSIWDVSKKDDQGNAILGDVMMHEASNSYIRAEDGLVAAVGVDNLVIVATKEVVLVANKDSVQDVSVIVRKLKDSVRPEWELHREVHRPWGKFDSIDKGDRYQVKRITVKPGAKLSIQKHHHRAEHWIVVSGTAQVSKGDESFLLSENESTYIPLGVVHALENPGKVNLELIEVQSGSYLGEDDIVRLEDRYGRA
jgi:mannose-1-phosphate guanylyltransferase